MQDLAKEIRRKILEIIYKTKSPHIGSCFSMVELFVAFYFKIYRDKDRFVLSKGHGVPALYSVLFKKGFISQETLEGFAKDGGTLEQHPTRNLSQGIEITSGSLGHGLSIGAGMALAGKYDQETYRVFVYLGDGELNEGSVWEAVMFAKHHQLDNLIAIVDCNKLQATGRTKEIIDLEPLAEKWRSFGWRVKEIDGHNLEEITDALEGVPFDNGKPSCLIAHTIKGKGVSFMENKVEWHDKFPDEEEYKKALTELK